MKNLVLTVIAILPLFTFAAAPVIISSSIVTRTSICTNPESSVLYKFAATDAEGDEINITGVTSSNSAVMDPSNISYETYQVIGNTYYFEVYGSPSATGTFFLTVTIADEGQSSTLAFPAITVFQPMEPQFTPGLIELCTGNGVVSLNNYVNVPGGTYSNWDYELSLPNGNINTDSPPFQTDDTTEVNYEVDQGGCYYQISVSVVIYGSAYVGVEATNATCGQNDGTASVSIDGPNATTISWSTGQQNEFSLTGLASGSYSVSATTPQGCVTQEFFQVNIQGVTAEITETYPACFGQSNGALELNVSGLTAPLSVLWSSGHSTQNLSNISSGYYTANITDATGCNVSKTFYLGQPDQISVSGTMVNPPCNASTGSVVIDQTSGGTGTLQYAWNNGATGSTITGLAADLYTVTVTDGNGCIQTKNFFLSNDNAASISGSVTPSDCGGSTGAVEVEAYPVSGQDIQSIEWSNGAATLSIASVPADFYLCKLRTTDNCLAVKGWNVPVIAPLQNNICVVTVDDATTTNLVVWDKVQLTGIDHYRIYRETSYPGNFALIDTVHADGESIFNDVVASPLERSWKYKISAVNTCNTESPLSLPHQTIHLDVFANTNNGVTIGWNAYVGTTFNNYFISRYTDLAGWEDLDTLPPNQLSYNDTMPFSTPGLDYVVEMDLTSPCTAEKAQDFNSSRSNKDKAQFSPGHGTGDSNNSIGENYLDEVSVAPNPAQDKLFFRQDVAANIDVAIFTMDGQKVHSARVAGHEEIMDISSLSPGVYIVKMSLNGSVRNLRIIKL